MLPGQPPWDDREKTRASIPRIRSSRLNGGGQPLFHALQERLLSWVAGDCPAATTDSGPAQFLAVAKTTRRSTAPVVVAIETEMTSPALIKTQDDSTIRNDWIHIRRAGNDHQSDIELSALLQFITTSLMERGAQSQEIILLGSGRNADTALKLLAMDPTRFCGIGLFNGRCDNVGNSWGLGTRLTHRAFVAASTGGSRVRETLQLGRLLHSAGMQVTTRLWTPSNLDDRIPDRGLQHFTDWTWQSKQ